MKKIFFQCLILCLPYYLDAQKEDYQWLLGGGGGIGDTFRSTILDFKNDTVAINLLDIDNKFRFVVAEQCDSNGNLLLYSNGSDIFNNKHEVIENGDSLSDGCCGVNIPQGILLLPWPGHPQQYFFFDGKLKIVYVFNTLGGIELGYASYLPFRYSIIDMAANSGDGKVIARQIQAVPDTMFNSGFTACRHANGRDWWVITTDAVKERYFKFILDPTGFWLHDIQDIDRPSPACWQHTCFSPDGRWYAVKTSYEQVVSNSSFSAFNLYPFDRCTGTLGTQIRKQYDPPGKQGNTFFSPDGRFVYAVNRETIYQYDLTASDILASETIVAEYDGFVDEVGFNTVFFQGKTAPDGKVYICTSGGNSRWMHVMEYPNRKGIDCKVVQHAIQLPNHNGFLVPNIPNHRLGALDGSACDDIFLDNHPIAKFRYDQEDTTQLLHYTFGDLSYFEPTNWSWNFGDITSGMNNTSQLTNPEHLFSSPGIYEVCLTVSNMFTSNTSCKKINVGGVSSNMEQVLSKVPNITIIPNPASSFLQISMKDNYKQGFKILIKNMLGQNMMEVKMPKGELLSTINISDLPNGIFRCEIQEGNLVVMNKLIVVTHR